MRRIAFFEDSQVGQFGPLTLLRPSFELLCGHFSVRSRTLTHLECKEWGALIRPELADTYRESHPDSHVNESTWLNAEPTLLVNGRWLFSPEAVAEQFEPGTAGWIGETLVFLVSDGKQPLPINPFEDTTGLSTLAYDYRHVEAPGVVLEYPWDLITQNPEQLTVDFTERSRQDGVESFPNGLAIVGDETQVFIHQSVKTDPYVVIDVTQGPVWIDADVKIQAFTRIEGPCYVGPQTQLFRANVREGCSFGPVCRLGGEIEESIIHGYSNKYHDGFLGHSYVGEWVNLGALTTNSDLKNDYSNVAVPLSGVKCDTESKKVGAFIGDHTKTALSSLFNTGTSVGMMSLVLPGGELLPKHIPSFSRVWHGKIEPLPDGVASGLETARYAMSRRDKELTPAMEALIRTVHLQTESERRTSLEWQDRRLAKSMSSAEK